MDAVSGEELGRSLILKNDSERLKGTVKNRQKEDYTVVSANKQSPSCSLLSKTATDPVCP